MPNRKHLTWLVTGILTVTAGSTAYAQWIAHTDGPDVFGHTKVVASVESRTQDGLVIQCDDKDSLMLAFVSPGTDYEKDMLSKAESIVPVTLLVKVDQGSVVSLDATLRNWNNTYIGAVASGRTPQLISLLRAIGAASSIINVGIDSGGNQQSESFAVSGSTSAVDTAMKKCKLGDIKPQP